MDTGIITLIVLAVAFLYSSVGFGGGSSYLAVMSVFDYPSGLASTIALTLNILVAGVAFTNYFNGKHLRLHLLLPFLITSVPAALMGGMVKLEQPVYQLLLNLILLYVALRLLFFPASALHAGREHHRPALWLALVAGGLIGLLSGMVGIGGGIFLSPLIVLAGWGNPKQAAASSAAFIVLNSLSGLVGRAVSGSLAFGTVELFFIPAGFVGAMLGSYLGARYFSNRLVGRLLGVVLLVVVARYAWVTFG